MKDVLIRSPWPPVKNEEPPLNEYPRPSLVREHWLNLNGYWDYAVSDNLNSETLPAEWEGKILVPFALETALSGVGRPLKPSEALWYHRNFSLAKSWKGKNIRLNFEAVDYYCECFINDKSVGVHKGGYLPFSFDVTTALQNGENSICLKITDPTDKGMQPRGKQVAAPEKIWYESTSGIWQTVWLEPVAPEGYIEDYNCKWIEAEQTLNIEVAASSLEGKDLLVKAELTGPDNEQIIKTESPDMKLSFKIAEPNLWSPLNPKLYSLRLKLYKNENLIDTVEGYTTLRTINKAIDTFGHYRILLNGNPIFVNGLLDQGYWPESGMTAPSDDALIFDIEETKKLGFNCLRKHIKIESRRWYYHADRLGMLVIQDMVSGGINWTNAHLQVAFGLHRKDHNLKAYRKSGRADKAVRDEFEESIIETIGLLKRYNSIVCWVPFNESWGQYDALRIGNLVSSLDSTRTC